MIKKGHYYDLDNRSRLPLEVINDICINQGNGLVRVSPSKNGFHVIVALPSLVCKKYSDEKFEWLKEELGFQLLFGNKGKKEAGKWWEIRNFGVYERC